MSLLYFELYFENYKIPFLITINYMLFLYFRIKVIIFFNMECICLTNAKFYVINLAAFQKIKYRKKLENNLNMFSF